MEIERIRVARRAIPFRPFNLVMRDGRRLPVDKRYYLGIAPDSSVIGFASVSGGFELIHPDAVTDLDFTLPVVRHSDAKGVA